MICRMFLQETYELSDLVFYDSGSSDKTSNYDLSYASGRTFTYDTNESAYKVVVNTNGSIGSILVNNVSVPRNVEIEYIVKLDSDYAKNTQSRLGMFNESNVGIVGQLGYWGSNASSKTTAIAQLSSPTNSGTTLVNSAYNFSKSTWYRAVIRFENGNISYKLYDTFNTLLNTVIGTTSIFTTENNKVGVQFLYHTNATIYFKEFKVKAL